MRMMWPDSRRGCHAVGRSSEVENVSSFLDSTCSFLSPRQLRRFSTDDDDAAGFAAMLPLSVLGPSRSDFAAWIFSLLRTFTVGRLFSSGITLFSSEPLVAPCKVFIEQTSGMD